MTDSEEVLRAALEAAGLSLQAIPEDQRAMFTSLTEEEVTRLITLRAGRPATAAKATGPAAAAGLTEATGLTVKEVPANDAPASTDTDAPVPSPEA